MEVAAFAVSLAALGVSGLAVLYTKRQATAAEEHLKIERQRRASEVAYAADRDRHSAFRLIRESGSRYHLVKATAGTAYQVTALTDTSGSPLNLGEFPPNRKHPLRVRGRSVQVTWHNEPDLSDPELTDTLIAE